ncbi:hypothetical protein HDR59_02870 [bacterium]|nr:hypothetical protein [bacterium]
MEKVNIEVLEAENDYLSFCLKDIRLEIKADKKILAENQKKYDDLYSTYGKKLDSPKLSARFIKKLFHLDERFPSPTDKKYINFANLLIKNGINASQIDEIISNLMLYPIFIERLETQKKKIGKQYYKSLVNINKYSR